MGSYLVFDRKENNTKSISYLMATIIQDVLSNVSEKEYGWWLKKKHVASLISFTVDLVDQDELLQSYIDSHEDVYGLKDEFEEIKNRIWWIYKCFVETLVSMILNKEKYIMVKWQ